MTTPAHEEHPLDADDEALAPPLRRLGLRDRSVYWWIGVAAAIAFAIALIGAVVVNNAQGDLRLESFGEFINRLGMISLLILCVVVLVVFRARQFRASEKRHRRRRSRSIFNRLLVYNFAGFFAATGFFATIAMVFPGAVPFISMAFTPVLISWLLVVALWHEGIIRAYCVGFLTCFLIAPLLGIISGGSPMQVFVAMGWGGARTRPYSSPFGLMAFSYLSLFGLACVSGMICAWYVWFLSRHRSLVDTEDG